MTASGYTAVIGLATLEGALVALPKADALEPLRTLRSPAWAALLPGSIVAGTFLPLAMPSMALGLVLMAGVITPLLAMVAVLEVVRGPRAALLALAFALAVIAALISGWAGQISATALTALGCLAVGTALARLIPRRWFVLGVLGMCLADVALLASGIGTSAAQLMASAARRRARTGVQPGRHRPRLGRLPGPGARGGARGIPRRPAPSALAAVLVAVLGAAYGLLLLPIAHLLPATVPIGLALLMLESLDARRAASRARTAVLASALQTAG